MNLDYLLISESQVDWYDGYIKETSTKADFSNSISKFIAEMGDSDLDDSTLEGNHHLDMTNIQRVNISSAGYKSQFFPGSPSLIMEDSTPEDSFLSARKITSPSTKTITPETATDKVSSKKTRHSHSNFVQFHSPSLFSDSESEVVNSSRQEIDLPQFVLDCPKKPILKPFGRKNDENRNIMIFEESSSLSPSPLLLVSTDNETNMNTILSLSQDKGSPSGDRVLDTKKSKLKLNKGKNSPIKQECERNKMGKCSIKLENIVTQNSTPLRKQIPSGNDLLQYDFSPLDQKAQKKFDIIDKCLLSSLAPVLHATDSKKISLCDIMKNVSKFPQLSKRNLFPDNHNSSSNSTCNIPQHDENISSKDCENNFYTVLAPSEKDKKISTCYNIGSRKKYVCIKVTSLECENIQEIRQAKNLVNNYFSLETALIKPGLSDNGVQNRKRGKRKTKVNNTDNSHSSLSFTEPEINQLNRNSHSVLQTRPNTRQATKLKSKNRHRKKSKINVQNDPISAAAIQILSTGTDSINHQNMLTNIDTRQSNKVKDKSGHPVNKQNSHTISHSIAKIQPDTSLEKRVPLISSPQECSQVTNIHSIQRSTSDSKSPQLNTHQCLGSNKQRITHDQSMKQLTESQPIESQGFVPCLLSPDISTESIDYTDPVKPNSTLLNCTEPFTPTLSDSF